MSAVPSTGGRPTSSVAPGEVALEVSDLRVSYGTPRGRLYAVDGVDLTLGAGESLGIVGESGCGKSSLGRGLMQLLPPGGEVEGSVRLAGDELVGAGATALRHARGDEIALIFQEPMTRLDPLMRVGDHFVEAIRAHRGNVSRDLAHRLGEEALRKVGIPPTRIDDHPHQFSGGMRQRIMIALGIALRPLVIIADEPTTALDVIVEAQILDLLDDLRREQALGLVLITHNLGIVAETCDRVAVMYAGRIVEIGTVEDVFAHPRHPYTQGLLSSVISLDTTELRSIDGTPPDLVAPPRGCRYAPRCPKVIPDCHGTDPRLRSVTYDHLAACILDEAVDPHPDVRPPSRATDEVDP
jgi:peptide/nickel transport system ATP-binding protein